MSSECAVEVRGFDIGQRHRAIRRIALAAVADDGVVRNLNQLLIERVQASISERAMHAGRENETLLPITASEWPIWDWILSTCAPGDESG